MPIHLSLLHMSTVTYMAINSALVMVCVSSWTEASIYVVMNVGECIAKDPNLDLPFGGSRLCRPNQWGCEGVAILPGVVGCIFVSILALG